jgi:hypothetical protein
VDVACITASQKGHNHRQTGLSPKFNRAGDLATFEHQVWQHLIDTGMDTIAYVPDPGIPTTMVNCVKGHGRYTVDSVRKMIEPQLLRYDSLDLANDREAKTFLLPRSRLTLLARFVTSPTRPIF